MNDSEDNLPVVEIIFFSRSDDSAVEHTVRSGQHVIWPPRHLEQARDYRKVAVGTIFEVASDEGRFRHEIFIPYGPLEGRVYDGSLGVSEGELVSFSVIRPVSRLSVWECIDPPPRTPEEEQAEDELAAIGMLKPNY